VDVRLPSLSGGTEYATVVSWFKSVGDAVAAGEPLLEVDSDKVTEEIVSPVAGRLAEIFAEVDDEIKVDALLAVIEEEQ
jgi:2-oxoglutarate dehydrogenase E2 component (dihydrolipoamide succinyltransferase)